MTPALISALIEKEAFSPDTIITAKYRSMDLFGRVFDKTGNFKVNRIISGREPIFELVTMTDGNGMVEATSDAIKAIDGMDLMRFADIYDLLPDGSRKKVGRKRGRKPKAQLTT